MCARGGGWMGVREGPGERGSKNGIGAAFSEPAPGEGAKVSAVGGTSMAEDSQVACGMGAKGERCTPGERGSNSAFTGIVPCFCGGCTRSRTCVCLLTVVCAVLTALHQIQGS